MSTTDNRSFFMPTPDTTLIFVSTPYSASIQAVHREVLDTLADAGLKEVADYTFNIKQYTGPKGSENRLFIYLPEKAVKALGDYYAKFSPIVSKYNVPLFIESSPSPYTVSPYDVLLPPSKSLLSYLEDAYAPSSPGIPSNLTMEAAFFATVKEDQDKLSKSDSYLFDLTDKDNIEKIKTDLGIRNTFIQLADVRYVPEKGIEVDISIPGRPVTTHVYNNIAKSVIAGWKIK